MKQYIEKHKKLLIGIVLIIVSIVLITFAVVKSNTYTRPDYDPVAYIYHSENEGMDAGTEYIYDIYRSDKNENEYFYIKSVEDITIRGSENQRDVGSGALRSKDDLLRLEEDIEKDRVEKSQYTAFGDVDYYYHGSECESIDVLGDKLF